MHQNDEAGGVETGGKERPNHNDKLRKLRVRAMIMVNVRPTAGIQVTILFS